MKEEKKHRWDVTIGLATVLIAALGLLIAKCQRDGEQTQAAAIRNLNHCTKIVEVAGVLSSEYTGTILFKEKRSEFESLYAGIMNSLNDSTVTAGLIELREAIRDYNPDYKKADALNRIKARTRDFARKCDTAFNNQD